MRIRVAGQSDMLKVVMAGMGEDTERVVYQQRARYQGTGVIYTRGGNAWFHNRGKEFISQPHDLVLMRSSDVIEYGPLAPRYRWSTYWTHFDIKPEWVDWLNWPEQAPGIMCLHLDDPSIRKRLLAAFEHLCQVIRQPTPFQSEFSVNALENLLLHCRIANPKEAERTIDDRILRVTEYISTHMHEHITLSALARVACLSPSHCEELFKEQMGMPPFSYLEMQRMRRARTLLARTAKPINQIALEVGYADPAYFSKRFHHSFHESPRDYRRKYQA